MKFLKESKVKQKKILKYTVSHIKSCGKDSRAILNFLIVNYKVKIIIR